MPSQLNNHLTLLEAAYAQSPHAPAFKLPHVESETGEVKDWTTVTYEDLYKDVMVQASYWTRLLQARDIPIGSVLTAWIPGLEYADITLILGLSRAGYVLELISFSIPTPDAVFSLAQSAHSSLLIADVSQREVLDAAAPSPVPIQWFSSAEQIAILAAGIPPSEQMYLPSVEDLTRDGEGLAYILHTSGSTSGRPKLVPWKWEWVDSMIGGLDTILPEREGRATFNWMGTACHSGQLFCTMTSFIRHACIVQPTRLAFSSSELIDMVNRCDLTSLVLFPPNFSLLVQSAKRDPEVLRVLQGLDSVAMGGMSLRDDDMRWCNEMGVKLVFAFGSTEAGNVLRTIHGEDTSLYKPVRPDDLRFIPIPDDNESDSDSGSSQGGSSSKADSSSKLMELVVLSHAKTCPDPSLRSKEDGHFHTGDLFCEVQPGLYESRGRQDDWIKLLNAGRCDTRAIENNVILTCRDLIHDCVATGSYRPEILLFIEVLPAVSSRMSTSEIKAEVLKRLAPTQRQMWVYEKIVSPRQVLVVEAGLLPRTGSKGNIRRKAVEEMWKGEIDRLHENGRY